MAWFDVQSTNGPSVAATGLCLVSAFAANQRGTDHYRQVYHSQPDFAISAHQVKSCPRP